NRHSRRKPGPTFQRFRRRMSGSRLSPGMPIFGPLRSGSPDQARPRGWQRLPRRRGAPGEEAVVLEARLAVAERTSGEVEDPAAGGFEHRLPGAGVPLHRRTEARVEIRLARREHAEFEGAAAFLPFEYRPVLEIFGEATAVL